MPSYKDTKTNTYYVQFYYTDWTGQRKHKVKRGFTRKKDADAFERSFKVLETPNDITVTALLDEFEKNLESQLKLGKVKISTFHSRKVFIALYIRPYFNSVKAADIKVMDVDKWLETISVWPERKSKYKNDPTTKTRRSSATINTARQILGQVFKFGIKNFGLTKDPTSLSSKASFYSNDERADFWTTEQFNMFLDNITLDYYRVFFKTMFYSGLRLGELLAITPADIEPNAINVVKTIVTLRSGERIIGTPKTLHSTRKVVIPHTIYNMLVEYMEMIDGLKPTDRIFPFTDQAVRGYMNSVVRRSGLPRLSPHGLRHSYASILYNESKNLNVVAKQLGHANADVTGRVYSHMLPDEDIKAVAALDNLAKENTENITN